MFIDKTEKELTKTLQTIIGIVERKQTLPILSNVLIEKEADCIRFTATDLEIQITTIIKKPFEGNEALAITVGGKKIPRHSQNTSRSKQSFNRNKRK